MKTRREGSWSVCEPPAVELWQDAGLRWLQAQVWPQVSRRLRDRLCDLDALEGWNDFLMFVVKRRAARSTFATLGDLVDWSFAMTRRFVRWRDAMRKRAARGEGESRPAVVALWQGVRDSPLSFVAAEPVRSSERDPRVPALLGGLSSRQRAVVECTVMRGGSLQDVGLWLDMKPSNVSATRRAAVMNLCKAAGVTYGGRRTGRCA
jgi:DNA-directed RNA polymerase specialized sigma24 family protein